MNRTLPSEKTTSEHNTGQQSNRSILEKVTDECTLSGDFGSRGTKIPSTLSGNFGSRGTKMTVSHKPQESNDSIHHIVPENVSRVTKIHGKLSGNYVSQRTNFPGMLSKFTQ